MKQMFTLVCLLTVVCMNGLRAQDDNPVQYMEAIGKEKNEINKQYLAYNSAMAHSKRIKKIDKMRERLLETIDKARYKILDMPMFKGDRSLKDASVDYLLLMYRVFNEDYAKIVNMEEIAEQSHDAMEAYLLAREKAGEKLTEAGAKMSAAFEAFAKKNHINLVKGEETDMDRKLKQVSEVIAYYNRVYLVFFKSFKQEMYVVNAQNEKNIGSLEQNKNALVKYATEGLAVMDTTKGFQGDKSLVEACRAALKFFKDECETAIPVFNDMLVKQDNFEKLKRDFDGKGNPTKEEVDAYNKAVNEMNAAGNKMNGINKKLNDDRNTVLNNWNKAGNEFYGNYIPR